MQLGEGRLQQFAYSDKLDRLIKGSYTNKTNKQYPGYLIEQNRTKIQSNSIE